MLPWLCTLQSHDGSQGIYLRKGIKQLRGFDRSCSLSPSIGALWTSTCSIQKSQASHWACWRGVLCHSGPTCFAVLWRVIFWSMLLCSGVFLASVLDLTTLGGASRVAGMRTQIQANVLYSVSLYKKSIEWGIATLLICTSASVSVFMNKGWSPLNVWCLRMHSAFGLRHFRTWFVWMVKS